MKGIHSKGGGWCYYTGYASGESNMFHSLKEYDCVRGQVGVVGERGDGKCKRVF